MGVVRDSRYGSVWQGTQPYVYFADSQSDSPANVLIVRTSGNPRNLVSSIAKEWTLYDFRTADELLNLALAPQRMAAGIFGAFGLLSMVLASLGLYSVMAYAVARRTREIGIRLAVGARPATLVRQVLSKFMAVAAIGVIGGTFISLLLARFVASQVKGVSVYDRATFVFAAALLATVAFFASAVPARRAARIEPEVALRAE